MAILSKFNKVMVFGFAALALLALGFYLLWQDAERRVLAGALAYRELVNAINVQAAENAALGEANGELLVAVEEWRARANALPPEREIVVVRRLPPDCTKCALNYELDRTYVNPAQDQIPAKTITVEVRDVLGDNRAAWTVDRPAICPACPPEIPLNGPESPPAGRSSPFAYLLAEGEVGYGVAGPEASLGVLPVSWESDKWAVAWTIRAHGGINELGEVRGNVLTGVRITRRGRW